MLLKNAMLYDEIFEKRLANIAVLGERIASVGPACAAEGDTLDLTGCLIVPGFIDIHTHGCQGADTCDAQEKSLSIMSKCYASHGVTSFCPTSMTLPEPALDRTFRAVAAYIGRESGAYIHGINMEGPFISHAKKGAQAEEFIRTPDVREFERLNQICKVCLVDIAPESEGALEFARQVHGHTVVSAAHTAADYETARRAFENGFTHATHLFNAMTGLTTREAGMVGAVLESDSVTAELICDGFHIAPPTLRIAFRQLGENRTAVVSDSMMAAGVPDGDYELGGQTVYVREGKALLADGTIAASTSNLHAEFCNLIRFGIPEKQAVKSCTINPARIIGADAATGSIQVGKYADLVVLDAQYQIRMVLIKGRVAVDSR